MPNRQGIWTMKDEKDPGLEKVLATATKIRHAVMRGKYHLRLVDGRLKGVEE